MKFIIAQSTIAQSAVVVNEITALVTGDAIKHTTLDVNDIVDTDHANYSVTLEGDQVVYEINDLVILKYFGIYIKVVRAVAPLVKPLMALFTELKADVAEIEGFMAHRK